MKDMAGPVEDWAVAAARAVCCATPLARGDDVRTVVFPASCDAPRCMCYQATRKAALAAVAVHDTALFKAAMQEGARELYATLLDSPNQIKKIKARGTQT